MALKEFGKCFKLAGSRYVMPYNIYTYENVSRGTASVQDVFEVLKKKITNNYQITLNSVIVIWIIRCLI